MNTENQTYYPTCRFCGSQTLPDAEYDNQTSANEAATIRCKCAKAVAYQEDIKRENERAANINKLERCIDDFCNYCEARNSPITNEIRNMLMVGGVNVLDMEIDTITINFARVKSKITTNAKGNLVVGFTYADSTKMEVI